MYTVLRFYEATDVDVQSLGQQLEAIIPGVFIGPDKGCPDRVSIPIAEDGDWKLHVISITNKIGLLNDLIMVRRSEQVTELDIAIEPEDCDSLLSEFAFDLEFLNLLASRKITLNMSIYGSQ